MLDLSINSMGLEAAIKRCKEMDVVIPTFSELKNPKQISEKTKENLKKIGLWDINPKNLYRVTWKNEPVPSGGSFGDVNYLEFPSELTGVKARIIALIGKWFPTGAHKVGATFGCLVPRLVTGQFNPTFHKAVWPSTGNFCRGGAYVASLLGCESIAILPLGMSKERFDWLKSVAGEIITTSGSESNVKEIFDKCWELKEKRDDIFIFNQFEEYGNHLWHYEVTGSAIHEVLINELGKNGRFAGVVLSSGSAGTTGCASFLKRFYPKSKLAVSEALQCPTLLNNGFGEHRIEGIGDKHIPWIHDLKDTDMVIAIDDEHAIRLLRLLNEKAGQDFLISNSVEEECVKKLNLLGISSISNLLSAIKFSKYYELDSNDIVFTVCTDSRDMYISRLSELADKRGKYSERDAIRDFELLLGQATGNLLELSYYEKKRIHNLKYYTWIEQQGRDVKELNDQWYDHDNYWGSIQSLGTKIDELIVEFNKKVGLSLIRS